MATHTRPTASMRCMELIRDSSVLNLWRPWESDLQYILWLIWIDAVSQRCNILFSSWHYIRKSAFQVRERELLFSWWPPGSSPPTSTVLIQSCCLSVCLMSFPNWQQTRILRNCHIVGGSTQQDLDFWQHKLQEEPLLPGKIKSGDCSWNGFSKRVNYCKSTPVYSFTPFLNAWVTQSFMRFMFASFDLLLISSICACG